MGEHTRASRALNVGARGVSRRAFFASSTAGLAAGAAAATGLTGCALADLAGGAAQASGGPGQRVRMQIFSRQRAKEQNVPPLMTVKDIVYIATIGGASANWLDKKTGSLTPGKEADVIMLAANAINVMPLNHAYGAIVLGMDTSNVDTVFWGGG